MRSSLFFSTWTVAAVAVAIVGPTASGETAAVPGGAVESQAPARSLEELRLEAMASLDGSESVFHIKGWVYGFIPGERPRKLFGYDGFNVRRLLPVPDREGDLYFASRELLFYTDPESGEVLREWDNPYTGEKVEVFPIQNDPVNFRYRRKGDAFVTVSLDGSREYGGASPPEEFSDYFVWHADIFPFYPLPGWEKNYTAAEMFDFYVPRSGLTATGSFETMVSWTRVGPWLPWMKMDGHDGLLVYHGRSRRLAAWDQLPEQVRTLVEERYPVYRHAPDSVDPTAHNETSWTFYMKEMKRRQEAKEK